MATAGGPVTTVHKDGRDWRVGNHTDVAWIQDGTTRTTEITSAIPPIYADYATILVPDEREARRRHIDHLIGHLRVVSDVPPWCLGYLETGADGVVFPEAPRTMLYAHWPYVLVFAGPDQAASWLRGQNIGGAVVSASNWVEGSEPPTEPPEVLPDPMGWRDPGPDLIFPADHSWLLSWLWDDDWRCLGGPRELVDALLDEPDLEVRRVRLGEDATPPGHTSY